MPLTAFQSEVFRLIAVNRSPDSYVAGASVIHREPNSPRYSHDIDLFHDAADSVFDSARKDAETLRAAGFEVTFQLERPSFQRANVTRGQDTTRLEWAIDSAFRFFPLVADSLLGFRLHDADSATNKVLAAVGRVKVRDIIDLLHLDQTYIPLAVAVWGACGKDEGFTPEMILQELCRRARFNEASLEDIRSDVPIDPTAVKARWIECLERAGQAVERYPTNTVGALFIDKSGVPVRSDIYEPSWVAHRGSIKGAWPVLAVD